MRRFSWIIIIGFLFLLSSSGMALGQTASPPKKTPELLSQGKKLYEQNCAACHGPKGDGKSALSASLKPVPSDFTKPFKAWAFGKGDLKKVFEVISKGIPNSAMIKWDQLSERERWALVYTVVEFAAPSTPMKKKK